MQYNHKIIIQFADEFDDYGQPINPTSDTMRCCILEETLTNQKDESNYIGAAQHGKRKNQYDMTILVSAKSYKPYSELFNDTATRAIREGRIYEVKLIKQINSFGGKPKYYQIWLDQVAK